MSGDLNIKVGIGIRHPVHCGRDFGNMNFKKGIINIALL